MNCDELQELLLAYVNGEIKGPQKDLIEEHLNNCVDCRIAMSEFRDTNEKLLGLRQTPAMPEIKEATMAKINSIQKQSKYRNWLRPASIAIPVVLILITFLALEFTGILSNTSDVIAKAYTASSNLISFRYDKDEYTQSSDTAEMVHTYHAEMAYSTPDNFYMATESYLNPIPGHPKTERIRTGNIVYVNTPIVYKQDAEYFEQMIPTEDKTATLLNMLADTEALNDEMIDGIECFHYVGTVDLNKFLEWSRPDDEKLYYRLDKNLPYGMTTDLETWLEEREESYRDQDMTFEFWIGKEDFLIRQGRLVYQTKEGESSSWNEFRTTTVMRYYDMNQNVAIEAPLDENGEILTGWTSYDLTTTENVAAAEPVTEGKGQRIPVLTTDFPSEIDKSFTQIEPVKSYRETVTTWEYYNGEFQETGNALMEYASDYLSHSKIGIAESRRLPGVVMDAEMVISGKRVYTLNGMPVPSNLSDLADTGPTVQDTITSLELLYNIETLPDEIIDGTDCYHFRGVLDVEKYLEQLYPEYRKDFDQMNESMGGKLNFEDSWSTVQLMQRNQETVCEYWIGKDDYLIRKEIRTERDLLETPLPAGDISHESTQQRIFEYTDFNKQIDIAEPVDADGNLLEGWTVTVLE